MATVTPSSNPRITNPANHTETTSSTALTPHPVDILNGGRQLWLGINNREPLTAAGIYQLIARRGRQCGVAVHRTGSGTTSATPGSTAADPKAT